MAALAPATYCVFSAWIIYISEKGCNSKLIIITSDWFLINFLNLSFFLDRIVLVFKLKIQRIFTKLSFAIYLTQFPIFFYNVGRVRNAEYFEFIKIMVSYFMKFLSQFIYFLHCQN